jgi:hypothetical protein
VGWPKPPPLRVASATPDCLYEVAEGPKPTHGPRGLSSHPQGPDLKKKKRKKKNCFALGGGQPPFIFLLIYILFF